MEGGSQHEEDIAQPRNSAICLAGINPHRAMNRTQLIRNEYQLVRLDVERYC